jgi:hypothetical protein
MSPEGLRRNERAAEMQPGRQDGIISRAT